MVSAFANAVATAPGSGTQTLEHRSAPYHDGRDVELAGVGFTFVFGLPVGDGGAEELFKTGSSLLVGELQDTECTVHFYAADHIGDEAHFAGRSGDVEQLGERDVLLLGFPEVG